MGHFSGFAGAIALAVLVIPVIVRTTEDMLMLVPRELREASAALGMPRAQLWWPTFSYRAARAGMITGVLLAIARISGETAPLLFTAAEQPVLQPEPQRSMASLPAVIFQFALSPYADWQRLAWIGGHDHHVRRAGLSIFARAISGSRK